MPTSELPENNKNHPYWNTPEGRAQKYFSGRMLELEHGTFSREQKIQNIYEAGARRVSEMQNKAAAINNEIDKIIKNRGKLTKQDEARLQELYKQRIPAEREANAWANEFHKWREQYKPKEKEIFQSIKLQPKAKSQEEEEAIPF